MVEKGTEFAGSGGEGQGYATFNLVATWLNHTEFSVDPQAVIQVLRNAFDLI